ncbi:MAG TPA: glycerophosphodiester phosphodiesterase family protein [Candidatus Dormibacteraeota bacterium]|nr:glycerophosphodiester phosphodiesterase family protein [Candidatus Dormibacteraeota bacterium]
MSDHIRIADRYREARESGRPMVGAHRGNSSEFPENTLAAFRSALDLGVDVVECDVHPSSDGALVVIHDPTLDRTTDGSGLVLHHTLEELRALDAGQGERVPLLSELGELVRDRVGLCIEIKQLPVPYADIEQRLVDAIRKLDLIEQTCVISFDHRSVARVGEIEPRLQTGILLASRPVDPLSLMRAAGAEIYSPQWASMDPDLIRMIHASGGVVGTWTVNDAAAIAWCRHARPDSIFTDRPREVLAELRD